ncbi:2-methoxy-6-polyprenyl-1,4-benzoquinol methylase, mitochondrial [Elysia marginata]|uniref:2-methoxy-6-polyprenyl-1,4-benzoquinol methylase, mitochondrial n=1 Tax=Elysia marginata TaxID=1093978 RepID=A0AAV4JKN9_9GAST|nr:2-methoxy-6-polyprenyl-1,4-benzoquinol methylase, mitochondrial [Elysia marginata]
MAAPLNRSVFRALNPFNTGSSKNIKKLQCVRNFHLKKLNSQKETAQQSSSSQDPEKETHFGFQSVAEEEKEQKVYEVFENVASSYDVMNDAMSVGIHRLWKDAFLEKFSPSPGTKLLDVAGGTGDIAFRFLKHVGTPTSGNVLDDFHMPRDVTAQVYLDPAESTSSSSSSSDEETSHTASQQAKDGNYATQPDAMGNHVTICDINQAMLDVGKQRAKALGYTTGLSWVRGNAECLPLPDSSFDAYTIAFGIRNCTHVQEVLNEAYRLLKPGGRFMCLEFSEVKNPLLRSAYDTYSFQVIPVMGQLIAGDWKSYQYLVESIRQFPNQEDFAAMIKSAGFRMVTFQNLTFGVAAIHSGYKI